MHTDRSIPFEIFIKGGRATSSSLLVLLSNVALNETNASLMDVSQILSFYDKKLIVLKRIFKNFNHLIRIIRNTMVKFILKMSQKSVNI